LPANHSLSDNSLRLDSPVMQPLRQSSQALRERVLFLSSSTLVNDAHRQRHHTGVDPGQLGQQLAVLPAHGVAFLFLAARSGQSLLVT
jgi:hypothetical protein